jgi:hypothetical protein
MSAPLGGHSDLHRLVLLCRPGSWDQPQILGACSLATAQRLTSLLHPVMCPEVDVAGQGDTIEQARANLQEARELFFQTASLAEIAGRLYGRSTSPRSSSPWHRLRVLSGRRVWSPWRLWRRQGWKH